MTNQTISIVAAGMVTSVGNSAAASCAAIRCALSNVTETGFVDATGEPLLGAQVTFDEEEEYCGRERLLHLVEPAVRECLAELGKTPSEQVPLLLCVAENTRPGRVDGLDALLGEIEECLGLRFHSASALFPRGRVAAAVAMQYARALIHDQHVPFCLIAGADSYLRTLTLAAFDERGRLLTGASSNGFIPGEAGAALLVCAPRPGGQVDLDCFGIGLAQEKATIESEEPLRADGLTDALKAALAEAGCTLAEFDYRISDANGEQYFFKEAALALTRTLKTRKETFSLLTPADCLGETGAASGLCNLAVALISARKRYAPGLAVVVQCSNDDGERAAMILKTTERGTK
jgi:3-oxoacyl-[acyl-carrier-protein] synthase-1